MRGDGLRDPQRPDTSDLIADLHSHPFDYADTRLRGDDARQPEAGGFVQRAELHFRSLAPAGADEHVDIVREPLQKPLASDRDIIRGEMDWRIGWGR